MLEKQTFEKNTRSEINIPKIIYTRKYIHIQKYIHSKTHYSKKYSYINLILDIV